MASAPKTDTAPAGTTPEIRQAILEAGGNLELAAKALGMTYRGLRLRLEQDGRRVALQDRGKRR